MFIDGVTEGPPAFLADKEQGLERKVSYATGHPWQPLTNIWEMGQAAFRMAERDYSTGGRYTKELKEEYKEEVKKYLDGEMCVVVWGSEL